MHCMEPNERTIPFFLIKGRESDQNDFFFVAYFPELDTDPNTKNIKH